MRIRIRDGRKKLKSLHGLDEFLCIYIQNIPNKLTTVDLWSQNVFKSMNQTSSPSSFHSYGGSRCAPWGPFPLKMSPLVPEVSGESSSLIASEFFQLGWGSPRTPAGDSVLPSRTDLSLPSSFSQTHPFSVQILSCHCSKDWLGVGLWRGIEMSAHPRLLPRLQAFSLFHRGLLVSVGWG